jgi:hypothetical protein
MSDWHGYSQHPDAYPERPWWRRWIGPPHARPGESGWLRADGVFTIGDDGYLAARDTAHPLPPPEPRCGQVWVTPSGVESMVQMVWPNGAGTRTIDLPDHHFFWPADPERPNSCWGSAPETLTTADWPPPGAVLVAGPGAPWAPMGGDL